MNKIKHFGDVKKINGAEVPIVDIICGGSPCQDLSVAGKRAGLAGERSGLFMEQIRIIKEMRNECIRQLSMRGAAVTRRNVRPRFMLWENVIGAFSSNKGEDFRAVLEETARIKDENAVIPRPEKGKWSNSGTIMGDGWSIAWRVHDAQFWGVPQRRKRIALVADFGGYAAPEVLFERKSLFGDIEPGEASWQDIAGDFGTDSSEAGRAIGIDVYNQQVTGETAATLTGAVGGTNTSGCKVIDRQTDRQTDRQILLSEQDRRDAGCELLQGLRRTAGNRERSSLRRQRSDVQYYDETDCKYPRHDARSADCDSENVTICIGNGQVCGAMSPSKEVSHTLNCMHDQLSILVKKQEKAFVLENHSQDCRIKICEDEVFQTLSGKMGTGGNNTPLVMIRSEDDIRN